MALTNHEMAPGVTPGSSKVFITGLWAVSMSLGRLLYRGELSRGPQADFAFRIWLLPQFSGQFLLPGGRRGDPLHKALGLGYLDSVLGA